MKLRFGGLQQLGRALMLPIAVLPIAGLLLRLGQPDLLGWAAMASAGDAIFVNLGLLFAVGVGVGLARENHGAAGLAAVVGYLVTTRAVESLMAVPPGTLTKLSDPGRTLSHIIAGSRSYNRLQQHHPAELSELFWRQTLRAHRVRPGGTGIGPRAGLRMAGVGARHGRHQPRHPGRRLLRAVCLWIIEPDFDHHRSASHPQQFRLAHGRRDYHGANTGLRSGSSQAIRPREHSCRVFFRS